MSATATRGLMARRSPHPDDGLLGEHWWTRGWHMIGRLPGAGRRRWASGSIVTVGTVCDGMRIIYRPDRVGD